MRTRASLFTVVSAAVVLGELQVRAVGPRHPVVQRRDWQPVAAGSTSTVWKASSPRLRAAPGCPTRGSGPRRTRRTRRRRGLLRISVTTNPIPVRRSSADTATTVRMRGAVELFMARSSSRRSGRGATVHGMPESSRWWPEPMTSAFYTAASRLQAAGLRRATTLHRRRRERPPPRSVRRDRRLRCGDRAHLLCQLARAIAALAAQADPARALGPGDPHRHPRQRLH